MREWVDVAFININNIVTNIGLKFNKRYLFYNRRLRRNIQQDSPENILGKCFKRTFIPKEFNCIEERGSRANHWGPLYWN